jgi:uncharacterized coiled-coil protein SlyX
MEAFEHRLKLLEQKLNIMQREISEVLGEMHTAMQMTMRGTEAGLSAISARVDTLEDRTQEPVMQYPQIPLVNRDTEGKEL